MAILPGFVTLNSIYSLKVLFPNQIFLPNSRLGIFIWMPYMHLKFNNSRSKLTFFLFKQVSIIPFLYQLIIPFQLFTAKASETSLTLPLLPSSYPNYQGIFICSTIVSLLLLSSNKYLIRVLECPIHPK